MLLLAAAQSSVPLTVTIAPGVQMPRMNLGTCCGSDPAVGVKPWLAAGGVGIDTANDYHDQPKIATAVAGLPRDRYFVTTKVPAGVGVMGPTADLECSLDSNRSLTVLKENLAQLKVDTVDLVLLHGPCELLGPGAKVDPAAANAAQWAGLQQALAMGLARAIGVSNYNTSHLTALLKAPTTTVKPAVNQCQMSINGTAFVMPNGQWLHGRGHDDATIAYCLANNITYEAYDVMNGCPFHDTRLGVIAAGHKMSAAHVCFRWVLQRGAIIATGTGHNLTKATTHSVDDLGSFSDSFELDDSEMAYLDSIVPPPPSV